MTPTVVLLHSPLTTAAVWGRLPERLRDGGLDVVVPDVVEDVGAPYAVRYVASAAASLLTSIGSGPCALVGHSGAGPLLPQLGSARHAAGTPVSGYLFLDAMLPRVPGAATRLELLGLEDDTFAHRLDEQLRRGDRFPDWTDGGLVSALPDADARRAVLSSMRPRGRDFFTEPLPQPEDWPDAPVAYLQLSAAYDVPAATARRRGWTVRSLPLNHFAMLTDPDAVAAELRALLA